MNGPEKHTTNPALRSADLKSHTHNAEWSLVNGHGGLAGVATASATGSFALCCDVVPFAKLEINGN